MSEYVTNANTSSIEMSSIIQSSGLIQSSFSSNNNILEENIQMRQAINHMVLRLSTWMRRNNEQANHVQILLTALHDSENKQQDLVIELKNLKEQLDATQSLLEEERNEKLKVEKEMEVAKSLILQLQEENWKLRQSQTPIFISRTPGQKSPLRRGFSSNPF